MGVSAPDAAWFLAHGFTLVEAGPAEGGGMVWRWQGTRFQFSVDAKAVDEGTLPGLAEIEEMLVAWQRADRDGLCVNCGMANGPLSNGGRCGGCEQAMDDFAAETLKDFRS